MQHELVDEPFVAENGSIGVPNKPGLGINVNEKVLAKYAF